MEVQVATCKNSTLANNIYLAYIIIFVSETFSILQDICMYLYCDNLNNTERTQQINITIIILIGLLKLQHQNEQAVSDQ